MARAGGAPWLLLALLTLAPGPLLSGNKPGSGGPRFAAAQQVTAVSGNAYQVKCVARGPRFAPMRRKGSSAGWKAQRCCARRCDAAMARPTDAFAARSTASAQSPSAPLTATASARPWQRTSRSTCARASARRVHPAMDPAGMRPAASHHR
jgi:hypothetical protein